MYHIVLRGSTIVISDISLAVLGNIGTIMHKYQKSEIIRIKE